MDNFDNLRRKMVANQLVSRGISDQKVIAAFLRVPRHEFVPAKIQASAYDDRALPIGEQQTISQPYMVAIMTELLALKGSEKVLEIGTGSGYQAAILAELCQKLYTVERLASLASQAKQRLAKLGYANIEFIVGDGTEGYSPAAPYDRIVVTAACPAIPPPLIDQLAEGGKLVIPLGETFVQTLQLATKEKGTVKFEASIDCAFVPLIGKHGWNLTG